VLCGIVISQFLWILGVSKLGIGIASFHLNAVPFYVMLIMVAFGGSWDWDQALGATILMLGVVVAQRGNAWVEDVIPAK
jgi:drug/metabolite transporter (DMT)-like permease